MSYNDGQSAPTPEKIQKQNQGGSHHSHDQASSKWLAQVGKY